MGLQVQSAQKPCCSALAALHRQIFAAAHHLSAWRVLLLARSDRIPEAGNCQCNSYGDLGGNSSVTTFTKRLNFFMHA
jgi:hypothetical protein